MMTDEYEFSFREAGSDERHVIIIDKHEFSFISNANPRFDPDHPVFSLIIKAALGMREYTVCDVQLTRGIKHD